MPTNIKTIIKLSIILYLLLMSNLAATAQREQWYRSDGDLSSSLISKILYDSKGMLWISTENGLNRFDGSKFSVYTNDPDDSTSLANNYINSLFEDKSGRLFIATHFGVQVYDPAGDKFSEPIKVKGTQSSSSPISTVLQLKSGELWALGNELYRITEENDQLVLEHLNLPEYLRFISHGIVDANDNVWVDKDADGLYRISPDMKIYHYFGKQGDPLIRTLSVANDDNLYAGSFGKGLYKYNIDTDEFEQVDLGKEYNHSNIIDIYSDEFNNLLIGTDGSGMLAYNLDSKTSYPFTFSSLDFGKLKIHSITKDNYGNLWIGVFQKGLLQIPPRKSFFRSLDQRTQDRNLIGTCCITSLTRDENGILWVGTDNDYIYAVDLKSHTSQHIARGVPALIMRLFLDKSGRLWVASYDGGAGLLDRKTGVFTPVKLTYNDKDVRHAYDFAEMPNGDILIATMGAGLFKYDNATGQTEQIDLPDSNYWITTVFVSEVDNRIYVGTYDGLLILSPDMTTTTKVANGSIIYAIHHEPEHHDVWLATNTGLKRLNEQNQITRTYTTADGLPSLGIYGIEHGDDALWLSTSKGLSKFKVHEETFTNFNVDHGLPNNEFSKNSSFKDKEGNIFFGGINGIVYFKASDINASGQELSLRVTDFLIGDESIHAGMKSGNRIIIDCPIAEATEFKLSYKDNSFTIRINTKEFVSTIQTDFYYSFDNGEWTQMLNTNNVLGGATLTFTNVPSGKHTLRLKAVNGGVESEELTISIDISTVWYATWWAKLMYVFIILLLLHLIQRQIRNKMQAKQEEERRKHKAEILESELQFFTNISHEIRTPLSLVVGPIQRLINTDKDPERNSIYRVIMRNSNRILRLVNELMDLRKIDNKLMKLRFSKIEVCSFINDLFETFKPAANDKNIEFKYENIDCCPVEAWVDTSNFDKIIMNLLSNALKYTPVGGTITIGIRTGDDTTADGPLRHYLEVDVTDTGIGISDEDKKSIFNRYFQASNNTVGGTGIGLHLTYQLVKLHYGTIAVTDNPNGNGTRFAVRIPLGNEHLNPEEISIATNDDAPKPMIKPIEIEANHLTKIDTGEVPNKGKSKQPRSNDLVYIVEDDEEIRNYLMLNLSKYYRVSGFTNGKEALDAIHKQCPSLVITDVMMPKMDGYALTRKIKQNINLNKVPVIILTAKTREEDNLEAIESGAAVYLSKPFNIDVLIKTSQNLIESVARLRNAFSGNQSQEDKLETIEIQSNDDKLMERVMKVVNKNISNSDITVEMIAREIGLSRVHLHRKLKELTNQSTRDFIRNMRLQAAAKLLREKKLTVSEVADLVGFKQANNFSTVFKEMFGMSPTAYSAKYQPQNGYDEKTSVQ